MHASKADLEPMVPYHLRPGHFVQTLEPVRLVELSPVEEATVARNLGVVAG